MKKVYLFPKVYAIWCFPLVIILMLIMLTISCAQDNGTTITYTTDDLTGVWIGELNYTTDTSRSPNESVTITFGPNGKFLTMQPSPEYQSISGNLSVVNYGEIKGTIITTHLIYVAPFETDTEITYMNWAGSYLDSQSKIITDMSWNWVNTNHSHGTIVISGYLIKQ